VLTYVAANVRRCRERHDWTQETLAERADVDVKYLQRVERGTVNLSVCVLVALAEALGVRPSALFRSAFLPNPTRGRPRRKKRVASRSGRS